MYAWQENGSVKTQEKFVPTSKFLEIFKPDPIDPKIWWPKFEVCKFRQTEMKRKECGHLTVRFSCLLLNETCSTQFCSTCTKREI